MINTHTQCYEISNLGSTCLNDNQFPKEQSDQDLKINDFQQKFIFKPFHYEQRLQQTLKHQLKSLNPQPYKQNQNSHQNQGLKNKVKFFQNSKVDVFGETSKTIKTNRTIWTNDFQNNHPQPKTNKNLSSKQNKFYSKSKKFLKAPQTQKSEFFNIKSISSPKNTNKDNKFFQSNPKGLNKKSNFPKNKNEQNVISNNKNSKIRSDFKRLSNNFLNLTDSLNQTNNHPGQSSPSMCQSIAMGSMMVQNFITNNFQSGSQTIGNQSTISKSQFNQTQLLNFYSLCMLLFPQNPKSVPCSVFVIDTLFYNITNESKEIIYVFKDRKRNMLVKIKNKGKSAFDLFLKRRHYYEIMKAKSDKLSKQQGFSYFHKFKKVSSDENQSAKNIKDQDFTQKNDRFSLDQEIQNSKILNSSEGKMSNFKSQPCFEIIAENIKHRYLRITDQTVKQNIFEIEDEEKRQYQKNNQSKVQGNQLSHLFEGISENILSLSSQKSVSEMKEKLTKLSFSQSYQKFINQNSKLTKQEKKDGNNLDSVIEDFQIITPSNSVRESFHTLQTNYMSLLKYNNGQIIRLKDHEFKSIYQNPLYANERFKNSNNTQYLQALPVEEEFKDIKVYSMHFHYELFKNEPLFLHVKNSLYKQNEYMTGLNKNYFQQSEQHINHNRVSKSNATNQNMSLERKNNLILKKRLRQQSIQVYLYYQIFQIYTYASMHHNKQIINGVFRFIEYDNDFALFETQNILLKSMPKDSQFIRAKIFNEQSIPDQQLNNLQQYKLFNNSNFLFENQNSFNFNQTKNECPSQTIKKITIQILKMNSEPIKEKSQVQKAILSYFSQQNAKIKYEMANYFTEKIQKIKNIKDMNLSKNIFKVVNGISDKIQDDSQSWINKSQKSPKTIDFHEILDDDKRLQKFLKQKDRNDQYSRKNISNVSVVRCLKEVDRVRQRKKETEEKEKLFQIGSPMSPKNSLIDKNILKRPQTANNMKFYEKLQRESSVFSKTPIQESNLNKNIRQVLSCQRLNISNDPKAKLLKNSQSSKTFNQKSKFYSGQKQLLSKQQHQFEVLIKKQQEFDKKLIKQRYTQFNKSKFKLSGFKADKFI